MLESVRARLTLWYVSLLATILVVVIGLIYVLLARALYAGSTTAFRPCSRSRRHRSPTISMKDRIRRTRRAAPPRSSPRAQYLVAIYDGRASCWRKRAAKTTRDSAAARTDSSRRLCCSPSSKPTISTIVTGSRCAGSPSRLRRRILSSRKPLEPTDEELESLRGILGLRGADVARRRRHWRLVPGGPSLSPVVAMADRARRIGIENLSERLPVANPRDELGLLAETFNALLARLEASLSSSGSSWPTPRTSCGRR